jgi:hypothetical protein
MRRRRFLRPSDVVLFFGVLFLTAAIGAKALGLWHEASPPRLMAGVQVIDGGLAEGG